MRIPVYQPLSTVYRAHDCSQVCTGKISWGAREELEDVGVLALGVDQVLLTCTPTDCVCTHTTDFACTHIEKSSREKLEDVGVLELVVDQVTSSYWSARKSSVCVYRQNIFCVYR